MNRKKRKIYKIQKTIIKVNVFGITYTHTHAVKWAITKLYDVWIFCIYTRILIVKLMPRPRLRPRRPAQTQQAKVFFILYYCRANDLLSRITLDFIWMKSRQFTFLITLTNAFLHWLTNSAASFVFFFAKRSEQKQNNNK